MKKLREFKAIPQGLIFLWLTFGVLWVCGAYTTDIFRVIFAVTAIGAAFGFFSVNSCAEWLRKRVNKSIVFSTIIFFFFTVIGSILFDYEGINGVADLTRFLQALDNYSKNGEPLFSITGSTLNYFLVHRSLSIHLLRFIYKILPHPWVALVWQGFFLTFPCVVMVLWYRAVCKKNGKTPEPLGELLACLAYAFMPTFMAQTLWPYTFHILGLTLLALAYLFYYEEKWLWWATSLIALSFEKEEYSFIAIPFALLVIIETFLKDKRIAFYCLAVIAASIHSYFGFKRGYSEIHSFSSFYGHLGNTPKEALSTLFTHPGIYLEWLTRKESLLYFWFFFAASFLWAKPKWSGLKYFLPVMPLLLLNCLSSFSLMQLLKDHYALPLIIGIGAVHIFGIFEDQLKNAGPRQSYAILIIITLFPLLWNHQATSRSFIQAVAQWTKTKPERKLLEAIRKNENERVCCEERPCSYLAPRPYLYNLSAPQCQNYPYGTVGGINYVFYTDPTNAPAKRQLMNTLMGDNGNLISETKIVRLIKHQ